MPLNLPSNPSNGQTYEDSVTGFTYQYDGSAWNGVAPPVSVLNNITVTGVVTATDFDVD
jgi:hypothetical protein|tara:strand:+ start:1271 stop:1447 length:177 start_codon:yes stop_codon:yes gene_type:complete